MVRSIEYRLFAEGAELHLCAFVDPIKGLAPGYSYQFRLIVDAAPWLDAELMDTDD